MPLHLIYLPIQSFQQKHWFILPPKKQAVDRLISVYCLCHICIIHLLLSKFFIYLDRQWSGQESMTASRYEKFSQLTRFNTNSPQRQKGTSLDTADILNSIASPRFRVSQRSVRERFKTLEKNFTKKMANEEKESGIICQTLHKINRAYKKLLQEKRMPVSFMKMNKSHKRSHE